MTNKTIIAGLVALAFVSGSIMASGMAYASGDKNGKPFEALWDAIHALETSVAEIELIPGPAGPPGPEGPQGETGPQGPAGTGGGGPILFSSGASFVTSGTTEHIGQGHVSIFSASTSYPVPTAGTISDLRVKSPVGPGVPGSGETRTVTVHKSIGSETIECTLTEVLQICGSTDSFTVKAGEQITVTVESSDGATHTSIRASMLFTPS